MQRLCLLGCSSLALQDSVLLRLLQAVLPPLELHMCSGQKFRREAICRSSPPLGGPGALLEKVRHFPPSSILWTCLMSS